MDKMGDTDGLPPDGIIYTGTRDDLQRKLRDRDDRITELEAQLLHIARQAEIADDPEHLTLDLIKRIALNAITLAR